MSSDDEVLTEPFLYHQCNLNPQSTLQGDASEVKIPINLNPISSPSQKQQPAADDDESYHVGQQTASWTFSSSIFKRH